LLDSLIIPGIGYRYGLSALQLILFVLISTHPLGFWTPLVIGTSVLTLVFALTFFVNRFTKKKERDPINADAFKPFLCGEEATDQYDSQSGLYYQSLIPNAILDKAERRSDVDRFYHFLVRKFTGFCNALSRYDMGQRFSLAFLSFIIGTIIVLIIVIFAV
jgi:hypothetical protein